MIIKVLRNQPELRITLVDPGDAGVRPDSPEGIRLIISSPPPPRDGRLSKIVRRGWWGWPPLEPPKADVYPEDPADLPDLVYPAFGFDDEGAVVFRPDRLLWERPCGRYLGRVVGDGWKAEMDIDLYPIRWMIEKVEVGP